ncbi:Agenet-like domain [Arabidopsis thaliana x Arabidopsis arenosa]|uniref:Agenet-like domain n=1 Tax=Arabidopsis thaliana x Arabidopsis arenosa TaxID=1240361 RepID=A0A8T2CUX0_9BRAS|nr:Agenet-like domain [Arabidopsis thaliana x Arabidopsis arenosa]
MVRRAGSERPSMEEGCEFEIYNKKDPRSYHLTFRSRNILEDVWYKAIVEAKPPKSPKSKRSVLCVRLLKDDFSSTLEDLTYKVLCRPVPPKHLLDSIPIKIGSIVEADYKDAWVTGFVVKEIDVGKCLVCFDSIPDVILFERKLLRPHLQWLDDSGYTFWDMVSKHYRKFLRRLAEEPMFSPGTMVEVSSKINEGEVVWVPSMVIKEFKEDDEYKYIVKDKSFSCEGNKARPNKTVDLSSLRPIPVSVDEYQLEENVEVFLDGMGWRHGRVMGSQERAIGTLSQKWCGKMAFGRCCRQGNCRLLREQDKTGDSVRNEAGTQRKALSKKTLPRNQNGSGNDSTLENENSEDNNRKRKREENLGCVASVEQDKPKDTTMVLPFEKKLRIWETLESMEVFKTVPQSPHFSPLLVESREDSREMSAVGMMLTFFGLLDEVKALQHNDPISFFISLTNSFAELEKHGFNVKAPQSRINKLLSLRDRQSKKTEELKDAEKVTAEKESVKAENKRKILELQRLNEEMDKEIAQSKSCAAKIVQQLDDVKLEFLATASAPW